MVKSTSKKVKGNIVSEPDTTDVQLSSNAENTTDNTQPIKKTTKTTTKTKAKKELTVTPVSVPSPSPIDANTNPSPEIVKSKRGRKSKKELMAALTNTIQLQINEMNNTNTSVNLIINQNINQPNGSTNILNDMVNDNENEINNEVINDNENIVDNTTIIANLDQPPAIKKRGRKPKGGKIIQQVVSNYNEKVERPNVILHLKCSMKDLQNMTESCLIESFNFSNKNNLSYDLLNSNVIPKTYNETKMMNQATIDVDYDSNDDDDDVYNKDKDSSKELCRKLKQLEHNLHINHINNKKSACFWCTYDFDNPAIYIPKHFINDSYHVYGCFCSPECSVAYLMNESIDSSAKSERYHLLNHIYTKIYEYKKNIKPAPNPYYMLEKFCGNLTIQEYRSLLRNERLFLIVDKPLTRILPELHEDNDEFILNNKIIPSNNYQLKSRLQKKKSDKGTIINEKFGLGN
jgi:hypothetical protein